MSKRNGSSRRVRHLTGDEWERFLCEVDCDIPFGAFQRAFDDHLEQASTSSLLVICSCDRDSHDPAFIRRCHLHADQELKTRNAALGYYRSLPWQPAYPISSLDRASARTKLVGFSGEDNIQSFGRWMTRRPHGICFYVPIGTSGWRHTQKENLSDLVKLIADAAGHQHDCQKLCLVFFVVLKSQKDDKVGDDVAAVISQAGGAAVTYLDDFTAVEHHHLHQWCDQLEGYQSFRDIVQAVDRDALVSSVFSGPDDTLLGEQCVREALRRIREFFVQDDASRPDSKPMFRPA